MERRKGQKVETGEQKYTFLYLNTAVVRKAKEGKKEKNMRIHANPLSSYSNASNPAYAFDGATVYWILLD